MVQPMQRQLSEFESPLMKQTWTLPAAHPQDFALHSSSTASDPDAILLVVLLFLPDLSFPLPGRSLRFPPTGIPEKRFDSVLLEKDGNVYERKN